MPQVSYLQAILIEFCLHLEQCLRLLASRPREKLTMQPAQGKADNATMRILYELKQLQNPQFADIIILFNYVFF